MRIEKYQIQITRGEYTKTITNLTKAKAIGLIEDLEKQSGDDIKITLLN